MLHEDTTRLIIKAFYDVYYGLGFGFLEKVDENALYHRLEELGLPVQQQAPFNVHYNDHIVGTYFADLLVNNCVIVELKTAEELSPLHIAQLLNYLKATEIEVGLLLNFGPKPIFKRQILSNDRKKGLPKR